MASYILQFSILLALVVLLPVLVSYGICLWLVRKHAQPYLSREYADLNPEIRIVYLLGMAILSLSMIVAIDVFVQSIITGFYRGIIFAFYWGSLVLAFTRCIPRPTIAVGRPRTPLWRLRDAVFASTTIALLALALSAIYSNVMNTWSGVPLQLLLFPPIIAAFLLVNLIIAWILIGKSRQAGDHVLNRRLFKLRYILWISVLMIVVFLAARTMVQWQQIEFGSMIWYLPVFIATFASLHKFPDYLLRVTSSDNRSAVTKLFSTSLTTAIIVTGCASLSWGIYQPANLLISNNNSQFLPEFFVDSGGKLDQVKSVKSTQDITVSISRYITENQMLVGETVSVAVSITNSTQNSISNLVIRFPESDQFSLPDVDKLSWPVLLPNETWNVDYFPARPLVSGKVPIIGELEYISHKSSKPVIKQFKRGFDVGGPRVSIMRQVFTPSKLIKGDASRVQVQIQNSGSAPAYDVTYEPNLGVFFSSMQTDIHIDTLLPGESRLHDYTAVALESGESIVLGSPEIQYFDLAQNIYESEASSDNTDFKNALCVNLDECREDYYIDIERPSPDYVPNTDEYVVSNVQFDKYSLNYNLLPGDQEEGRIKATVNGQSDVPVTVSLALKSQSNSNASDLQFSYDKVLSHNKEFNEIPIQIYIPPDTDYGTYKGNLVFDFSKSDRKVGSQNVSLPVSVSVTPIQIKHIPKTIEVDVGSPVDLSTIVTNRSDKTVNITVIEDFNDVGIDLINSTGAVGTCKGTSGLNYYQCYSLKPDEQVTRNILIELTEPLPRVKRLVGKVDYETDGGVSGSIRSVAELIVSSRPP